jgi:hypothetical protein
MWQICRQSRDKHLRGGALGWNIAGDESICLRHVLTGDYLCSVSKSRSAAEAEAAAESHEGWAKVKTSLLRTDVRTTPYRTRASTRFNFKPVLVDGDAAVRDGDFCQIANEESDMFIHLWQQHLKMTDRLAVHLIAEPSFEDVFQIRKVPIQYLRDFYMVQGACEVPQQLLIELSASSLLETDSETAMHALINFESQKRNASNILRVCSACFKSTQNFLTARTLQDIERQGSRRKIVWSAQTHKKQIETLAGGVRELQSKDDQRFATQKSSMIRLAIMVIHKTFSMKTAETLQMFGAELAKRKGNAITELFNSALAFLETASRNPDTSILHPEKYIKRTLQSYYRTIAAHLLFLDSKEAGKLLCTITDDEQDLNNAARLERKGDFDWLLEFVFGEASHFIEGTVRADYFRALAGLCVNGQYASRSAQRRIGIKLVDPSKGRRDVKTSVLDQYHIIESKWMHVKDYQRVGRRMQHNRIGDVPDLVDPLNKIAARTIEVFWLNYQANKRKKRKSITMKMNKMLKGRIQEIPSEPKNLTALKKRVVQVMEEDGELMALFPNDDSAELRVTIKDLCQDVNDQRMMYGSGDVYDGQKVVYKEPSLAYEEKYYLLEAHLAMMAALCKSRSPMKAIVAKFYGVEIGNNVGHSLWKLVSDQNACHGLRSSALELIFQMQMDTEYTNQKTNVTHDRAPWTGAEFVRQWPKKGRAPPKQPEFNPFIKTFHNWLVGLDAREHDVKVSFVHDVSNFCKEMIRIIVGDMRGWNGVNSSGREPFHQRHGEFVCKVLETIFFLVTVGFYSDPKNPRAKQLLNRLLYPIVGSLKNIFDGELESDADTLARTQMLSKIVTKTFEIIQELFVKFQESSTIEMFVCDYQELYATNFENLTKRPKRKTSSQTTGTKEKASNDRGPTMVETLGVERSMKGKVSHKKVPSLTDPDQTHKSLPRWTEATKKKLKEQYDATRKYLTETTFSETDDWVIKLSERSIDKPIEGFKGLTKSAKGKSEKGKTFKDIFIHFGRHAPQLVATAAMNLFVRVFQEQRFFFDTLKRVYILANENTVTIYEKIKKHARLMRRVIRGNLISDEIAQIVQEALVDPRDAAKDGKKKGESFGLVSIVEFAKNADQHLQESSEQRLCYTEGLAHLVIQMVSLQLDLKQDGKGENISAVEKMLITGLKFLKIVSRGCTPIQELMYLNIGKIMDSPNVKIPIVAAAVAEAFIPTFKQAHYQARVRKHIPLFCNAMLRFYESQEFVAEFLDLLKAMTTPIDPLAETSVVMLNQAEIIAYLMTHGTMSKDLLSSEAGETHSKFAERHLLDQSLNRTDQKPAEKGTKESIKEDKQFIISLVELYASCGQGRNVYIESISRKWIDSGVIKKALSNVITTGVATKNGLLESVVQLPRFKALLTFYYHIYISDKCSIKMVEERPLIADPLIWMILEQCTKEITNVFKIIQTGDRDHSNKAKWIMQKELGLNVCLPFVTQLLQAHFTNVNIKKVKVKDLSGESDLDADDVVEVSRSELEGKFNKLARELMTAIVHVSKKPDESQIDRWDQKYRAIYGSKLFELFQTVASVIHIQFGTAFDKKQWSLGTKKKEYKLDKFLPDIQASATVRNTVANTHR